MATSFQDANAWIAQSVFTDEELHDKYAAQLPDKYFKYRESRVNAPHPGEEIQLWLISEFEPEPTRQAHVASSIDNIVGRTHAHARARVHPYILHMHA